MIERDYDPSTPVREAILKLLLAALTTEVRASAQELVVLVADHPEIEPHRDKNWGDLPEGEKNAIAREVGFVARDASGGAAGGTQPGGERLH